MMETVTIPRSALLLKPNAWKVYSFLLYNGEYEGTIKSLADKLKLTRQEMSTAMASLLDQAFIKQRASIDQARNLSINEEVTMGVQADSKHAASTDQASQEKTSPPITPSIKEKNKQKEKIISFRDEKRKPLEERQKEFYESLIPFVEEFGKDTVRAFYDYWSEPYQNIDKFRKEGEKTWDTRRRLSNWRARDIKPNGSRGLEYGVILENSKDKVYEGW